MAAGTTRDARRPLPAGFPVRTVLVLALTIVHAVSAWTFPWSDLDSPRVPADPFDEYQFMTPIIDEPCCAFLNITPDRQDIELFMVYADTSFNFTKPVNVTFTIKIDGEDDPIKTVFDNKLHEVIRIEGRYGGWGVCMTKAAGEKRVLMADVEMAAADAKRRVRFKNPRIFPMLRMDSEDEDTLPAEPRERLELLVQLHLGLVRFLRDLLPGGERRLTFVLVVVFVAVTVLIGVEHVLVTWFIRRVFKEEDEAEMAGGGSDEIALIELEPINEPSTSQEI